VNEIVQHYLLKELTPAKESLTKRICIRDEMKALTFTIIADLVLGLDLEKDRETIHELKALFIVLFDGLFMPTIPVFGTKFNRLSVTTFKCYNAALAFGGQAHRSSLDKTKRQ
jgi:cytochrome P450